MRRARRSSEAIEGFAGRVCAALGRGVEPETLRLSIEAEFEAHPETIRALKEMAEAIELNRLFRRCAALRTQDGAAPAAGLPASPPSRPAQAAQG